MKWVILVAALLGAWPIAQILRRRSALQRSLIWLVGFLPFWGLSSITMNPISYEAYRGDARGMEVTLIDIILWVLVFALPPRRDRSPYAVTRGMYLVAVVVSVFLGPMPHYALFGLWKVLRLYLAVSVLARAFENLDVAATYLRGMGWGVLYAVSVALKQRYVLHQYQIPSTFPHQNTLGMAIGLLSPIVLAILLAGQGGALVWATLGGMVILLVLGLSRGALVVCGISCGLVYVAAMLRGLNRRKMVVAMVALLGAAIVLLKSYHTIVERFEIAPQSSAEARLYFEQAAGMMVKDHPWGIGINQFSHVLEHGGYAARLSLQDANGLVHNLYWLTAAELGYWGLALYLLLLAAPLALAIRGAWLARSDIRGDVLLGCAAGMLAVHAHGVLEWVGRQTVMGYLYWAIAGMVYCLYRSIRGEQGKGKRENPHGKHEPGQQSW